ncbi:hypothetical protein T06_3073 [Trichinella sp. T6]|nr:hypothetical protein T06_1511 [Trichinella sp. T6]KRX71198.1 hypothetical protein T06_3073 [Trichinella sp. T6]
MSTRRRGRVSEKEQAQCDGGRTGADPEADPPAPPGSGSLQFNKIHSNLTIPFVGGLTGNDAIAE